MIRQLAIFSNRDCTYLAQIQIEAAMLGKEIIEVPGVRFIWYGSVWLWYDMCCIILLCMGMDGMVWYRQSEGNFL
jgi:hypothetical protein